MAYEGYHLVCVHSFDHHATGKKYTKGMMITDPAEVETLHVDKEHNFVRVSAPASPPPFVEETDTVTPAVAVEEDK
jgi:hypothetical protein